MATFSVTIPGENKCEAENFINQKDYTFIKVTSYQEYAMGGVGGKAVQLYLRKAPTKQQKAKSKKTFLVIL